MSHLENPPSEANHEFAPEKEVSSIEFDEEALMDQMYKILKDSKGHALIKGEINQQWDPVNRERFTRDQFNTYIAKLGGKKFLKRIFQKGKQDLKQDFTKQKRKLEKYKRLLSGKGEASRKFKESAMGDKIIDIAMLNELTDYNDLTFEMVHKSGFYGDQFNPDLESVAVYGLSWFEYFNRRNRRARLKRAEETAASITYDNAPRVPRPEKTPAPKATKKEAPVAPPSLSKSPEKPTKKVKSSAEYRKELKENGIPALEAIKSNYSQYGFSVETQSDSIKLVSKTLDLSIPITIVKVPSPSSEAYYTTKDYQGRNLSEAIKQVSRIVKNKVKEYHKNQESRQESVEKVQETKRTKEFQTAMHEIKRNAPTGFHIADESGEFIIVDRKNNDQYNIKLDSKTGEISIDAEVRVYPVGNQPTTYTATEHFITLPASDDPEKDIRDIIPALPGMMARKKAALLKKIEKE